MSDPIFRTDSYHPAEVERKWQRRWDDQGTNTYESDDLRRIAREGKPFYNLMMFPYPSAEGLHVGNIYAFTGADICGRFKRLQGHDVFEPIGFDAFGIHSENFALKLGLHPMELIPRNIERFTRQLRRVGLMYDWNHTVDTTSPDYYRWTQWIFLQLFKAGLAVKKEAPVNWCPGCHTVLANEQVIAGFCERCGSAVEMRTLSQWFFKITDYAGRLLDNLTTIDWSESTKKAQENWIGRSEGAELEFPIVRPLKGDRHESARVQAQKPVIRVYTTRPDTVFGATYMVLAPEHPLVEQVTTDSQRNAVDEYRELVARTDLVSRKTIHKLKSGVDTGGRAINPATGRELPIWIADYVLMEYGTGAIMAVPGHDERDFEFATQFGLPIVRVVASQEDAADTPLTEAYVGPGRMVNSDRFDGMSWQEAKPAVTRWLEERGSGRARTNYRLHDWCISRQRYWGPPIPILYCDRCGTVPVPESDLPVELPVLANYKPDESGISPLARAADWYRTTCPSCRGEATRETDVSDTFLDSAWYFLRYPSARVDALPFDPEISSGWLPVDSYIGGNEHAVLHLLYSRFVTMALKDLGHIDFEEPFQRFRAHGLIVKDGAKMSKSRGNVVVPDEFIEEYGADAFRTYLMFLGPYEEGGDFREAGITGPYNFLTRLWDTVGSAEQRALDGEVEQKLHATIKKVSEDLEALSYNTAVAAMMEFLNVLRAGGRTAELSAVIPLVTMVAPFAPHVAEELWERLGRSTSIFDPNAQPGYPHVDGGNWPVWDPALAIAQTVEFVVQVNGKVRARITMARGIKETEARDAALADPNVQRFLDGLELRKTIFVADRLINLVVG